MKRKYDEISAAVEKLGEMLIAKARDPQLPQAERERVRSNGVAFLRHAANAKNGYAAYRLGELLWAGKEVARDEAAALAAVDLAAAYHLALDPGVTFGPVRRIGRATAPRPAAAAAARRRAPR